MRRIFVFCAFAILLLPCGCQSGFRRAEIVGVYQAKVDYGVGALVLYRNGSYAQNFTYRSGRIVKNTGKYTFRPPNNLLLLSALTIEENLGKPNYGLFRDNWNLTIESVFGAKYLEFNPDRGWSYKKIK